MRILFNCPEHFYLPAQKLRSIFSTPSRSRLFSLASLLRSRLANSSSAIEVHSSFHSGKLGTKTWSTFAFWRSWPKFSVPPCQKIWIGEFSKVLEMFKSFLFNFWSNYYLFNKIIVDHVNEIVKRLAFLVWASICSLKDSIPF